MQLSPPKEKLKNFRKRRKLLPTVFINLQLQSFNPHPAEPSLASRTVVLNLLFKQVRENYFCKLSASSLRMQIILRQPLTRGKILMWSTVFMTWNLSSIWRLNTSYKTFLFAPLLWGTNAMSSFCKSSTWTNNFYVK